MTKNIAPVYGIYEGGSLVGLQGQDVDDPQFIPVVATYKRFNRDTMAGWVKARAKALGGKRGRVLKIGDSTWAGAGAGGTTAGATALVDARKNNVASLVAGMLTARGIPANNGHFLTDKRVVLDTTAPAVTYQAYDPKMAAFTGAVSWSVQTLGGFMLLFNGVGAKVTYTPTQVFDRIKLVYVKNAGTAQVTVDVDGGAVLQTITAAGAAQVLTTEVTCARGNHAVNLTQTVAGSLYMAGMFFEDTQTGAVDFIDAGYWGGRVEHAIDPDVGATAWSPGAMIAALQPDHVQVELTINDARDGTTPDTYEARLRKLVATARNAGATVELHVGVPFDYATEAIGKNLAAIEDRVRLVAEDLGLPLIDFGYLYGAHPNKPGSKAPADWWFDSAHPTKLGNGDRAAVECAALMSV